MFVYGGIRRAEISIESTVHQAQLRLISVDDFNLVHQTHVILQTILAVTHHVSRVHDGTFGYCAGSQDCSNANLQVLEILEAVEDSGDVHVCVFGSLHKGEYCIIGQTSRVRKRSQNVERGIRTQSKQLRSYS